jgi:hypothetical protein
MQDVNTMLFTQEYVAGETHTVNLIVV